QIDRPAATDMRPRTPKVPKDVGVLATGFLQGIGKHSEAGEGKFAGGQETLFVGDLGEGHDGSRLPRRGGGDGTERVAENATKNVGLDSFLGHPAGRVTIARTCRTGICEGSKGQIGVREGVICRLLSLLPKSDKAQSERLMSREKGDAFRPS